MSTASTVTSGGLGLGSAAFLVLLVLKVLGYIDMHWFWVLTSMLWIPVATFLAVMTLVFGVIAILYVIVGAVDIVVDGWRKFFN